MNVRRRRFLHAAAAAAVFPLVAWRARAETYPARPVHIVLGFPPGGSSDVVARLFAAFLSERLGAAFVVDNRPGAGSNIGTETVIRSAPDGYTLLLATSANAINATLYDNLNFDFIRDSAPVGGLFRVPNILEVHPSLPVKTVSDFIAYAKANPGRINFASGGIGSVAHVAGELFKFMTGIDMRHVPYRGSAPALIDLLDGEVQAMFDLMSTSIAHVRAGALRALAVTTAARSPALPDVPTVGETVSGYEASTWNGIAAPKGTPPEILATLNAAINAGLADPAITSRLADLGAEPLPMTPDAFAKLVADETAKWGKVIAFAGIKPG